MIRKVSVSETGQDKPVPSRAERDAACSSDAGRKAVEEPVKKVLTKDNRPEEPIGLEMETAGDDACEKTPAKNRRPEEPIGLEMETLGDESCDK